MKMPFMPEVGGGAFGTSATSGGGAFGASRPSDSAFSFSLAAAAALSARSSASLQLDTCCSAASQSRWAASNGSMLLSVIDDVALERVFARRAERERRSGAMLGR